MRKIVLTLILAVASLFATKAQEGYRSILVKGAFQTNYERIGIGLEGRYFFTDNIRIAPDLTYFFPGNSQKGLDVNANFHFVLPLQYDFTIYPIVGIAMVNNRLRSVDGKRKGDTDFGINLGLGTDYYVTDHGFISAEMRYAIQNTNNWLLSIGYGIRF